MKRFWLALATASMVGACGQPQPAPSPDVPPPPAAQPQDDSAPPDAAPEPPPAPPRGTLDDPLTIDALPFHDARDTTDAPGDLAGVYACNPDVWMTGGGFAYRVEVKTRSLLRASVDRIYGEDVNVDVHLLTDEGQDSKCIAAHDTALREVVEPGTYLIVIDTQADAPKAPARHGPYMLDVSLEAPPGPCAMERHDQLMLWWRCSDVLDCRHDDLDNLGMPILSMPATGPVVAEAHLVTDAETFPGGWPKSGRDGLARHFEITQKASGYKMPRRRAPWAPAGEGLNVSRFGEGSTFVRPPPEHETWYMNMFWAFPPPPATRVIIINPANGRAVVAAAGYEKGPGSSKRVGGASEETLHHLRSRHRGILQMGLATDQTLPFGPIECFLER